MDWVSIRPGLAAIVSTITGIAPTSVVWRGDFPATSVVVGTRAVLSTASEGSVGVMETRLDVPLSEDDNLIVTRSGIRRFTWNILIESQNQGPTNTSRILADRIRALLTADTTLSRLSAIGCSVNSFLYTAHNDFLASGRIVNWATTDILMNSVSNVHDDAEDAGNWIGEVLVSGDVKNEDADRTTIATITEDIKREA